MVTSNFYQTNMSICCTQIIDQAHDQANGGIIGVTEDPSALIRWMIAGPEVSQLFVQYDSLRSQGDCCTYEPSRTDTKSATGFP